MARASLHDLVIEARLSPGLDEAALLPLVHGLPAAGPEPPARLVIALESARVGGARIAEITAERPLFFHGKTRGFATRGGGGVTLTDGASWVSIDGAGARIEGEVDERSLADGYSFPNTTLFIALMIALRSHGLFHLHAGAVVRRSGQIVLLCGEGGSGKTTSTVGLVASGAEYVGDDTVLVCRREGAIALLAVPKTFHLDERSLAALPEHRAHLGARYSENHGKRAFDQQAAFGSARHRSMAGPPSVVLFTEIAALPRTAFTPLPEAEAMGEITRSAALVMVDGLPGAREQLALFAELVAGARSFSVALGADALADPGLLDRALEALG